jgi:hypothetical protein
MIDWGERTAKERAARLEGILGSVTSGGRETVMTNVIFINYYITEPLSLSK